VRVVKKVQDNLPSIVSWWEGATIEGAAESVVDLRSEFVSSFG
jgi:hypothetical protein